MHFTADQQFWWNWWVQLGVAIGTIGAVCVALWAVLRRQKPSLKLRVLDPQGESTNLVSGEQARYYHLQICNEERSSAIATQVQVFLTRIEESDWSTGIQRRTWKGNVPMRWRDQEFVPRFQSVGSTKDCDLLMVGRQSGLRLLPLYEPTSHTWLYPNRCKLVMFLQARSDQVDSQLIVVEVSWDGEWADGSEEMVGHLKVGEQVKPR